jgi:hypothetical protein
LLSLSRWKRSISSSFFVLMSSYLLSVKLFLSFSLNSAVFFALARMYYLSFCLRLRFVCSLRDFVVWNATSAAVHCLAATFPDTSYNIESLLFAQLKVSVILFAVWICSHSCLSCTKHKWILLYIQRFFFYCVILGQKFDLKVLESSLPCFAKSTRVLVSAHP